MIYNINKKNTIILIQKFGYIKSYIVHIIILEYYFSLLIIFGDFSFNPINFENEYRFCN